MGTSISALLIISVLLTAVVVMFKANQIGAELLAVANKNAAETIADKVSTKIEISSAQDFKASYEEVTEHNPNDVEGCKRIYPGLARTGDLTVTNEIDCYWFLGPADATARLKLNKIMTSPLEPGNRDNGGNTQISVDYYGMGEVISNATDSWGDPYQDLTGDIYSWVSPDFILTGTATEIDPYRLKIWSATQITPRNEGGYKVLLTIDGIETQDLSEVACVTDFKIKNTGGTAFDTAEIEEQLDIFVILNTDANNTAMKIPVKGTPPLQPNQWTYSIADDNYQTGTFNPGETMTLVVNLDGEPQVSGTLLIALPNGVDNSYSFPSICSIQ